ncbi:MAG TPA: 50S ribosomal protein L24 [Candidatus Nanoarchaeia archaeon]|nr:50S ribosomal protein L24 [Candidatus Nanoarchaeia archaeon]
MKTKWSKSWKASKQPRKQRKYLFNAPLHIARKLMSVILSKELRSKHKKRNIPVRKNDKVKITTGQFKSKTGIVTQVDTKHRKVYVEGIHQIKRDGTRIPYGIHPSNLMITELNMEDKARKKALERK